MKKSSKDLGISERISQLRKHFALSYDALADKVGASGQTIANIEQGKSNNPGAELLVSISSMLGIRLDWLLLGEGQMLKSPPAEDTGTKNPVVSDSLFDIDKPTHYEHGKPVTRQGRTVTTFRLKDAQPEQPPGTDLVNQVVKNTREIELMQQVLETVVADLRQLQTK